MIDRAARAWLRAALLAVAVGLGPAGCGDEPATPDRPVSGEAWKARRAELDARVWADETLAGEHEQTLVALWDALLAAGRRGDPAAKADVLASLDLEEIAVGRLGPARELAHGIQQADFGPPQNDWTRQQWAGFVAKLAEAGYQLVQSEWHHARFAPASGEAPARSTIDVVLHVRDSAGARRIVIEGELDVDWSGRRDARGHPVARRVDASRLRMLTRGDAPAFERILEFEHDVAGRRSAIHPVLVYDLDRDGLAEIVLVRAGRVLRNLGEGRFESVPLLSQPSQLTETGVIADLDGDARPDLLSTRARGDLVLYRGDGRGGFSGPPLATPFDYPLRAPSVLTLGDVDADGDLDVWLAQYKPAYEGGQMPTPYYDANDGYPAHLLENDGSGRLSPLTESAGLAPKRLRRTYASSFVDLDEDGDLDLVVVSDYAGVDLYHNDGSGRFSDANDTLRADRHLFGMSASFADYDLDGRLDFFVAGMASTTARRLEALGLGRDDRPDVREMRMRMAFGNRMYLAAEDGWREPDFAQQVARTGWTWGTSAFDFDNDGDPDLFAANGHRSGETTDDYCSDFWRHDIYDGISEPDPGLGELFQESALRLEEGRQSWDGYQKNHLLMNLGGRGFVDVAFLLGVADEFDSRSAVAEDLDRDGRVDLVVVEGHGPAGQRLHVYRNRLETDHAWIGVELVEQGGGVSPVGASIRVETPERTHVASVVTGDTLMGQHSTTRHFGLGASERVDAIEVRWIGGARTRLESPEPGRYHRILAPAATAAP